MTDDLEVPPAGTSADLTEGPSSGAVPSVPPLGGTVSFDDLVSLIAVRLNRAGASADIARILAADCAACERDGTLSHGVFRVSGYVDSLSRGIADGHAMPVVERVGSSFIRVDACNGFSQPALAAAQDSIVEAVRDTGVAVIAIRESHHFSALWPELEEFARSGLVAIGMIAGGKTAVIPHGADHTVFGTNPFGFATPTAGGDPVVFDFATSSMSHGDLQLHRNEGRDVPTGTGVDGAGNDTTDPERILAEGGLSPFGGHKGALLSFMIETLAAGLTGAGFSYEVDAASETGAHTFRAGQLYIVIDPDRGFPSDAGASSSGTGTESGDAPASPFASRVAELVGMLRDSGMSRLPGDRRYRTRRLAEEQGIPVTDAIRALIG